MIKRPYPPGPKGKRRRGGISEFGKELQEKQKLKNWYNLRERQFSKYVKEILSKKRMIENLPTLLIEKLESRLDNIVFKLGFAASKNQARQMVSHGYFFVNGRKVNISSFQVKKGDVVSLNRSKLQKKILDNLKNSLKKQKAPTWLDLDAEKMEGKVIGLPKIEEVMPPVEISAIFEYYSR